jgi:dihydrodipicolinate synthase/N-acetylneuraminate lyase
MSSLYDCIGGGYRATRRPDPRIAAAIDVALGDARSVLNVGAGAGAYEPPDREVLAVEPSATMIEQRPHGSAPVIQASAERLPLDDHSFDAALAVNTVQHWTDLRAGLRELRRVSRARVVTAVRASLAVVPYYVRPSEAAIVAHFQAVAKRSPVPLIVYNIPYRTGRGLGSDALLELAGTENIVGVKQAVGGIDADTLLVLADAPPSFSVLGGDDAFLFPLVLMGGAGAIAASANVATDRYAAMIDAGAASEVSEGRRLAESLLPLTHALFAEPSPAVIKGVLHAQGRIPTPHVRMPLADASPAAIGQTQRVLEALTVPA